MSDHIQFFNTISKLTITAPNVLWDLSIKKLEKGANRRPRMNLLLTKSERESFDKFLLVDLYNNYFGDTTDSGLRYSAIYLGFIFFAFKCRLISDFPVFELYKLASPKSVYLPSEDETVEYKKLITERPHDPHFYATARAGKIKDLLLRRLRNSSKDMASSASNSKSASLLRFSDIEYERLVFIFEDVIEITGDKQINFNKFMHQAYFVGMTIMGEALKQGVGSTIKNILSTADIFDIKNNPAVPRNPNQHDKRANRPTQPSMYSMFQIAGRMGLSTEELQADIDKARNIAQAIKTGSRGPFKVTPKTDEKLFKAILMSFVGGFEMNDCISGNLTWQDFMASAEAVDMLSRVNIVYNS